MNYDRYLNRAIAAVPPSGIRRFFDMASTMKGTISLGVGEPDFVTPYHIRNAAIDSLLRGETQYTANRGLPELREAVSRYMRERFSLSYDPKTDIVITVGASEAIDVALRAITGPGDEILVPEPSYVSYSPSVIFAGGVPVPIVTRQEREFRLDADALRAAITPRTKALILPYPNNPTGAIMPRADLEKIAEVVREKEILVLSDEIYCELTYGEEPHTSFGSLPGMAPYTVTLNCFSKSFAMTGWRVGYAAGRSDVIKGITKYQTQMTSSINSIAQKAAAAALLGPQDDLARMVEVFKARRDYVYSRLNAMPGISCPEPHGAFYMLPDVSSYFGKNCGGKIISNAVDFTACLLDRALISVVPGEAYFIDGKVRVSYSNSMENLKTALDSMESVLAEMR